MFVYSVESELHKHIVDNFNRFFEFDYISSEFIINSGRIDIVGKRDDTLYIVELKRDKIDQQAINQLSNYLSEMKTHRPNENIVGIAAAPRIDELLELGPLPIKTMELKDVRYEAISRMVVTLEKDDHERIKELAEKDNRNVSNYMQVLIKEHIEKMENTK